MSRAGLLKYALAKPGAALDHPWGEDVVKVGGKVFAFFGVASAKEFGFGVKLSRSLLYARSLPYVEPMGYGLGKAGWVGVKRPKGALPVAMFKEWVDESYTNVAPKKISAAAAPRGARARGATSRPSTRRAARSSPARGRPTRS